MVNIKVVVLVDAEGSSASGSAEDFASALEYAQEQWDNDIGGNWDRRINMEMSIDVTPVTVKVNVPAMAEPTVIVQ